MCVCALNCVQLFATRWTVVHKLLCPWHFPGGNTGVGCHFLLQQIFPTQGLKLPFLRRQAESFFTSATGEAHNKGSGIEPGSLH